MARRLQFTARAWIRGACLALALVRMAEGQTYFAAPPDTSPAHFPFMTESVSFADIDNDGWTDFFLVAEFRDLPTFALYHNEANGSFADQTFRIDVRPKSKVTGVSAPFGDYDNDGDEDLFVPYGHVLQSQRGSDLLLRNQRGTFVDVAASAGLAQVANSSTAEWVDLDADGWLDLFVSRLTCCTGSPDPGSRSSLFRNQSDGTFSDIAAVLGLDQQFSPWGGTDGRFADLDGDGLLDFYATTFLTPSRLFLGTDAGLEEVSSPDLTMDGESYGAALGDIDGDGDLDLFVLGGGNVRSGLIFRSGLILNLGDGAFVDVTEGAGIADTLLHANALGAVFVDVDNDADLDLVTATPLTLHLNDGHGVFTNATAQSGLADVGNSVAAADWNRDGHLDLAFGLGTDAERAASESLPGGLFLNSGSPGHWLQVELVGVSSNRDGIGAWLTAVTDRHQVRQVFGGTGKSQHDRTVHFGLADRASVDTLEIRWPSGQVDVLSGIPADRRIRVIEGRGAWYPALPCVWDVAPALEPASGAQVRLTAVVRPALFEPGARITRVAADLGSLGGPPAMPLIDREDGSWRLDADLSVAADSVGTMDVYIDQETSLGAHWIRMSRQVRVAPPSTVVTETRAPTTPDAIALHPAYPNPFNPETTIPFDLPVDAEVDLAIYNVAGQRVATLVSGHRVAGIYLLHWDGRDDAGRSLASGIYVCRLLVDPHARATHQLLLLK